MRCVGRIIHSYRGLTSDLDHAPTPVIREQSQPGETSSGHTGAPSAEQTDADTSVLERVPSTPPAPIEILNSEDERIEYHPTVNLFHRIALTYLGPHSICSSGLKRTFGGLFFDGGLVFLSLNTSCTA